MSEIAVMRIVAGVVSIAMGFLEVALMKWWVRAAYDSQPPEWAWFITTWLAVQCNYLLLRVGMISSQIAE